jgi:WD40 repeat protein
MLKKLFLFSMIFISLPEYAMWNLLSGIFSKQTQGMDNQVQEKQSSVHVLKDFICRQKYSELVKNTNQNCIAREKCSSPNSLDLVASNNDPKCIAFVDISEQSPRIMISDADKKTSFASSLVHGPSLCFDRNDEHVAAKVQVKQHLRWGDLVRIYNRTSNTTFDIPALLVLNMLWNKTQERNLLTILTTQAKVYEVQNNTAESLCVFDHDVYQSSWVIQWHPKKDIMQVALNREDATLAFVDGISGKTIQSIKDKRDCLDDSAFNRDGSLLAVTAGNFTSKAQDYGLSIYDVSAGKLVRDLSLKQDVSMYHIAGWHGQQVAFMDRQKVQLYDIGSGKVVRSFQDEDDIRTSYISPDGVKLMVAKKNEIKVIDIASGKLINSYPKEGDASAIMKSVWNCDSSAIYYMQQGSEGAYIYEGLLEK